MYTFIFFMISIVCQVQQEQNERKFGLFMITMRYRMLYSVQKWIWGDFLVGTIKKTFLIFRSTNLHNPIIFQPIDHRLWLTVWKLLSEVELRFVNDGREKKTLLSNCLALGIGQCDFISQFQTHRTSQFYNKQKTVSKTCSYFHHVLINRKHSLIHSTPNNIYFFH
jgi:hypothetical protein